MKNTFKFLIAGVMLAFGTAVSANTLTVDFGGVYGGFLSDDGTGSDGPFADDGVATLFVTGTDINISTMSIQDDNGTTVYDVTGGELNFDTAAAGFEMTITGAVADLGIGANTTLFEGSFTSWSYSDSLIDIFSGSGSGAVGAEVLGNTVSTGDNPFAFGGFSLESSNGDVLSTDFLMTATGTRTPEVPVPAAVWLFGSGLIGLVGIARRKV